MKFIVFICFVCVVYSEINEFTGEISVDWFDPLNWSLLHSPYENESVVIDGQIAVLFGDRIRIKNLDIRGSTVFSIFQEVTINGTLTINSSILIVASDIRYFRLRTSGSYITLLKNAHITPADTFIISGNDTLVVSANVLANIYQGVVNFGTIALLENSILCANSLEQYVGGNIIVDNGKFIGRYVGLSGKLVVKKACHGCEKVISGKMEWFNSTIVNESGEREEVFLYKYGVIICF